MKHFFSILFICLVTNTIAMANWQGDGTAANPYQITSKKDMEALADSVNNGSNWGSGKYFKLMSDIIDSLKVPIGNTNRSFNGVFDGNGKKINISFYSTISDVALFISLGVGGVIKNLIVDGLVTSSNSAAGFVIIHNGLIENCVNYASIISNANGNGTSNNTGGFVANNGSGSVYNSINYGAVNGGWYSGGIIGSGGTNGNVTNCMNVGFIYGYRVGGGINGSGISNGKISNCVNIGIISNTNKDGKGLAGGIVGYTRSTVILTNCINSGLIINESGSITGGILGNTGDNMTLTNCINTGVIYGSSGSVGGILGSFIPNAVLITNCYYDKQMCLYGGIDGKDEIGKAEGRLTKEMIGDKLKAVLGTDWFYSDNLYPRLKGLEDEIISKIAASPAYLDDVNADYDVHNNIRECFWVNVENKVLWDRTVGCVEYSDNGKVYLEKTGVDTMFAYIDIGGPRKAVPIRVNKLCQKHGQKIDTINVPFNLGKIFICSDTIFSFGSINSNTAGGILVSSSSELYGADKDLFSYTVTPTLPVIINPGEQITYYVTFTAFGSTQGIKTVYFYETTINLDDNKTVVYKIILTGEIIGGITATPNPLNFGDIEANQTYYENIKLKNLANQQAKIKTGYLIKNTYFKLETILNSVVINSLDSLIAKVSVNSNVGGVITDTLIVITEYKYCDDTLRIPIIANVNGLPIEDIKFTIRASENKLLSPTKKNYKVPIYITANADITNNLLTIKQLLLTINRNIFHPKSCSNGAVSYSYNSDTINIKIENVKVPIMDAGKETLLLNLVGDILLGNTDTSAIHLVDSGIIITWTNIEHELIDGCITINICEEGGDRLLMVYEKKPGVFVLENPVSDLLKVKCICYEKGYYYLEIINMLGQSFVPLHPNNGWNVNPKIETEFYFDLDIPHYLNNSIYHIIMYGPTKNYYNNFIIVK